MNSEGVPKLSLVAQFDDMNRLSLPLCIGMEDEFVSFIKSQNALQQDLDYALKKLEEKDRQLREAKKVRDALEIKLRHARKLIETEMHKRRKIEDEKKSLERQIAIVVEVLFTDKNNFNEKTKEKLAFLNSQSCKNTAEVSTRNLTTIEESIGSLLSPSDVSFDKTDDDMAADPKSVQERSKHGSYNLQKSFKKPKYIENYSPEKGSAISFDTDIVDHIDQEAPQAAIFNQPKRHGSEPAPNSEVFSPPRMISKSDNEPCDTVFFKDEPTDFIYSRSTPPIRRFSSIGMNKNHVFCTKTVIRPETCQPCNMRIGFYKQALKCQDCRVTCHPDCKKDVPLPCYPLSLTPTNKRSMGTVADFVPSNPPFVPALLVHCVNEIELRGLDETGLYRISGSEREVKELKEKFFKGKCVPCLNKIDVHAICGTIKEFLRSLHEPLITRKFWKDFINAAETGKINDEDDSICGIINKLPPANRDTLAYLILHLHCVANSPKCRMPIENLAKIFGPTIVGYSSADPATMISETTLITKVMKLLLQISPDFWQTFVQLENSIFQEDTSDIIIEYSHLGPVSPSATLVYKSRGMLGKTPLSPRNDVGIRSRQRKPFFSSPLLK